MPKVSGIITGRENTFGDYSRAVGNTYSEYKSRQQKSTWKQQLDEVYAYRAALEKKFGKDALKESKKAVESVQKYQSALQKKLTRETEKQELQTRKQALDLMRKEGGGLTKEEKKESRKLAKEVTKLKFLEELPDKLSNVISSELSKLTSKVDNYISVFNSYAASINTRLQGTSKSFTTVADVISTKLTGSPYVKQTEVLEKLNELVSAGISYNVEQRSFLAAMADKIVTTFDAADATLLRIIRLQQADSTVARMGMESLLNKYLNAVYEDTSYLSDMYNSVESSLVDAISQLSVEMGVELEYAVQKWFGSLYSVGMSPSTLSSLAEGINYLASGNVSSLSSNSTLQNLLVMGANKAGLNYASMLTGGVSSEDINKLIAGVVSYAQDIAEIDNLVVKNQYARIFGLTMSDLTALLQMGDDLSYVIEQTLSYSDAVSETANQLTTVGSRVPLAEKINNVFDNLMLSAAEGIATNVGLYATWLITNIVEEATGGINIPFVSVLGTGIDLNTTVTQLMKTGLIGASLLGQIANIIQGIGTGGSLSLSGWGASDYTSRGSGFLGIDTGVNTTTSQSMSVGNASGSDITANSITQAKNEVQQSVSGQETESQEMMEELNNNVATMLRILETVYDNGNAIKVKVVDYGLTNSNPNISSL